MEPGYGLAIVKHGGILTFTGTKYKYDGGLTEEFVLDSDRVSYAEMKGILMDKGHVEANFKIYFKVGVNMKILHSDQSSIEFGECIRNNGEVLVFVAHGEGINSDYIPFNNGSDSGRNTEVIGSQGGNANIVGVGLDDIEDDDLGFDEINRLIDENNSDKYDTSSESDDSFDEYDGETDDSEDDELCVARENLRKAAEKKSDLRSLSKIVKEIEIADSKKKKLKENCDDDLTQHMDFDVDSGDSYDTESEDEICRRRKSKLQKPDKNVKPPRKPRRKKNVVDEDAQQETSDQQRTDQQPQQMTDQQPQQRTDQQPQQRTDQQPQQATDRTATMTRLGEAQQDFDLFTRDLMEKENSISRKCKKQRSCRGSSSQPAQRIDIRSKALARLEEANDHLTQLTRELMDNEKNSDVIVEPSTEKNPGTISQSNMHDTTTERPWFQKLAPPPLPKGHAHFRSTGLMYHDPQGKKGVTASQIKKMWVASSKVKGKKHEPSTQ
ncbi:hypothetical protein ACFE04_016467 [Oxalis oulophora]